MMKEGTTRTFLGTTLLLFIFWLLITGTFHYQSVILGIIVCFLVSFFFKDIFIYAEERPKITLVNMFRFMKYLMSLIVAIIEANIQVALIVLNPKMPISPTVVEFKTNLKDDLSRVVFANSITLTPGTLTVDLEGDVYLVHGLTRKNAVDCVNWHMALKLLEIEEGK